MNDMTNIESIENIAQKRNDEEFKENKKNINFSLRGYNKYYYANQCRRFTELVTMHGYPYIDKKEIDEKGISFNKHSINVGYSQHHRDLKKFNSTDEMLGWIVGYCDGFATIKRNLK